jgi:hypothetical protein
MHKPLFAFALALMVASAHAETKAPDLTGTWQCDRAPMLIRGEWTTLKYDIEISQQRDNLVKGTFAWTLSEENGVKGEGVTGERSFKGEWTALGVIGFDGKTVEVVSYKDLQRHSGTLEDANTIRFVHSKVGDDAWMLSRT